MKKRAQEIQKGSVVILRDGVSRVDVTGVERHDEYGKLTHLRDREPLRSTIRVFWFWDGTLRYLDYDALELIEVIEGP